MIIYLKMLPSNNIQALHIKQLCILSLFLRILLFSTLTQQTLVKFSTTNEDKSISIHPIDQLLYSSFIYLSEMGALSNRNITYREYKFREVIL